MLCPANSNGLGLPRLSASSLQLKGSAGFHLGSPPWAATWKLSMTVSWGSHRTHLICFMCLMDDCRLLPNISVLKTLISYIVSFLGGCFRWEGKPSPCYSILAGSRSTHHSFWLWIYVEFKATLGQEWLLTLLMCHHPQWLTMLFCHSCDSEIFPRWQMSFHNDLGKVRRKLTMHYFP